MNLQGKRILVTGAAGGIGRLVCLKLVGRGAELLLADRPGEALDTLLAELGGQAVALPTNLLEDGAGERLAADAQATGQIDVVINLAGIMSFRLFQNESADNLQRMWQVNVIAPMQLTRALLPAMIARGSGRIVNIGSIFGSIAFACFTTYSANKFAVRGFSEALRRELEGSGVDVTYIAPRYTKTAINAGAAARMSEALKMNMDEPDVVAANILRAIEKDAKDYYIGFPECLFVRINAILPRLVDGVMRKQNAQIREFARNE
jgi:short-subunit dehydrogenase